LLQPVEHITLSYTPKSIYRHYECPNDVKPGSGGVTHQHNNTKSE
jgi:hypothetical protein